jgi:hypothetical protein
VSDTAESASDTTVDPGDPSGPSLAEHAAARSDRARAIKTMERILIFDGTQKEAKIA